MEGSESGAVVPSDLEAETWVKIWNFPAEFLFADEISFLVSSFGSVVGTDEDTYEKLQNHLRPSNLRQELHSSTTFVTIFVRVSVTKPLPSRVAVGSKKGREFIIGLDFDPTPKVCLLCHGAGHFDFECGTDKKSVETIAEAGVGFEEVNDVAVEDVGAAMSKVSFGDPRVLEVDPLLLPPAPCVSGATDLHAVVGDLVAIQSFSVLEVPPTVEDVLETVPAAGLEVQPLLPAPIAADGSEGTLISDWCDSGMAKLGDLEAVQTFPDSFDDDPLVGKELAADPLATVGESIATDPQSMILADPCIVDNQLSGVFHKWRDFADAQGLFKDDSGSGIGVLGLVFQDPVVEAVLPVIFHYFEQVFSVVISPKKHHKWRDKSDVKGLFYGSYGLGSFGLDEDPFGD